MTQFILLKPGFGCIETGQVWGTNSTIFLAIVYRGFVVLVPSWRTSYDIADAVPTSCKSKHSLAYT